MQNNKKIFFTLFFLCSFNNLNAFSLDSLANNAIKKIDQNNINNEDKLDNIKISNDKILTTPITTTKKTDNQNIINKKSNSHPPTIIDKIKKIFTKEKSIKSSKKKFINNNNNNNNNKIVKNNYIKTISLKFDKKTVNKILNKNISLSYTKQKKIFLKIYNIKRNIIKDINNLNYKDLYNQLDNLKKLNYVKKDLKENFYVYTFWKILLKYSNRKDLYIPKIKKESFSRLSRILSYLDVNKDFDTKFANNVFKLITHARMYNGDDLLDILRTYFPYGLNNEIIFYKLLKIMNSDYIKKNTYVNLYKYLINNFYDYFNSNSVINFQIVDQYFQILIKFGYESDFITNDNPRILNNLLYQNSLNSNLYYYKALFYKYFQNYKKMKNYLFKAIQYNGNNNKAWFELISYFYKNRINFIIKTLKFYKIKNSSVDDINYLKLPEKAKNTILNYDNKIFKQINYYLNNTEILPKYSNKILLLKGNLYFIEGTNFQLPDKLYQSAKIYYSIGKCNLISNIINIIGIIEHNENEGYSNKIKNLYQKCSNNF